MRRANVRANLGSADITRVNAESVRLRADWMRIPHTLAIPF